MRRLLRLTDRFFFSRSLLVQPRTPIAAALAATIGRLVDAELPGPSDFRALIPSVGDVWVRQVLSAPLWVFYTFTEDELTIRDVRNLKPIPLDD